MSNLIDRDALMELARNHIDGTVDCNDIARFPTVDAEPVRRASWILERDEMRRIYTKCDNCKTCVCFTNYRNGMKVDMRGANYCPNCGAKLDL